MKNLAIKWNWMIEEMSFTQFREWRKIFNNFLEHCDLTEILPRRHLILNLFNITMLARFLSDRRLEHIASRETL